MKRDDAVNRLRAARKELQDTLVGLTEEDLLRPNAIKKWSIKDLLAHIAAWDEELLRVIQAFAMQDEPQYSYSISDRNDFAEWNVQQVEQHRPLSLHQVLIELENARRDLIQSVEGATDQVLLRRKVTSWGAEHTGLDLLEQAADHDLEHASHIRSYRKKRERWARARAKYVSKRREAKSGE